MPKDFHSIYIYRSQNPTRLASHSQELTATQRLGIPVPLDLSRSCDIQSRQLQISPTHSSATPDQASEPAPSLPSTTSTPTAIPSILTLFLCQDTDYWLGTLATLTGAQFYGARSTVLRQTFAAMGVLELSPESLERCQTSVEDHVVGNITCYSLIDRDGKCSWRTRKTREALALRDLYMKQLATCGLKLNVDL